jgi:hypothetical protein
LKFLQETPDDPPGSGESNAATGVTEDAKRDQMSIAGDRT